MYRTTDEAINLLNKNYRQVVRISFNGTQETLALTEANILQGGFSITRGAVSGDKLEIGSAVAAELKIQLDNRDGRFDETTFEGAELFVEIGVKKWDAREWEHAIMHWIPCGYFTVDEPPRALRTISLSALDRMVKFDRVVDTSLIQFPISVEMLVNRCCTICGVTLASGQLVNLPNKDYLVSNMPSTEQAITYRNLIRWAAAIMGTCAYIDWDGKLRFQWYVDCEQSIDSSKRYSSDMLEQDVTITGIAFTDTDKVQYLAGTKDYALDMTGNFLIQHDAQQVVNTIYQRIGGFTYRPYTATIKPSPYLFPLDVIDYVDKNGDSHVSVITNVTFTINGNTKIDGKGETTQASGYATPSGMTAWQSAILEQMKVATDNKITSRQQSVLELNELIANSLGLYKTLVVDENGSVKYYFHDRLTLDASTVIYTMTSGGFAITNDWNDGDPVWQYGLTRNGNAVINALSAYKVTADLIAVDYTNGVLSQASTATDNKLTNYSTTEEMNTAISLSAQGISADISRTYETKQDATTKLTTAQTYADNAASDAEAAAKADTTTKLQSYYTKTEADAQMSLTLDGFRTEVSRSYETKSEAATLLTTAQTYADNAASDAEAAAKADTTTKLQSYYTKTEADAQMSLTLDGFRTEVSRSYETKSEAATLLTTAQTYADNAASDAEAAAKADTTTKLQSYYTKTQTDSAISQSAQDILLSVSSTYATQTVVAEVRDATIVSDQLHYLATSASSGVTTSTSGWTTTPQSVTATDKYLWTYHTYTYGDSTTKDTSPVITGVYGDQGQTGPAGGTGPQGPTGTSVSEVIPLYYASSSSTAPSAPTSNVTRTSTVAGYWTRSLPAVSTSYPYLYTCDQVKYSNNTYAWTTVVKDNAICDLSTRMNTAELKITDSAIISTVTSTTSGQNAINSLIEQKADSIRLQASTIAWDSQYSSMSSDGKLECQEASVTGSLYSGKTNGYYVDIDEGIIRGGKSDVIGYDNFISFQGVFGDGDGPYLKGDNITFEGDIKVIDNYTIYTGYSGPVKIPTSIRSDGTVATWMNISFINGLLMQ